MLTKWFVFKLMVIRDYVPKKAILASKMVKSNPKVTLSVFYIKVKTKSLKHSVRVVEDNHIIFNKVSLQFRSQHYKNVDPHIKNDQLTIEKFSINHMESFFVNSNLAVNEKNFIA